MSTTTLCQVCESAVARHACDQCGAAVCSEHFDREYGVCLRCASSIRGSGSVGERPSGVDDESVFR